MKSLLALFALLPALVLAAPEVVEAPVARDAVLLEDEPAEDAPSWPKCLNCKTTGQEPCPDKVHKKVDCELEANARYCSMVFDCETCAGVGFIDCTECERPDVEGELATKAEGLPAILKKVLEYDEEMGFELHTIVSDNFELVWEIESMKVGRKKLDQHELMHLWVDRLEELREDYVTTLKVKEGSFRQRIRVFVWWLPKDQKDGSLRFCQQGNEEGVKLLGLNPTYSLCGNKKNHKNDESLHRNIVHNVAHLLLSHQDPMDWIGNKKGGWADAGLAHRDGDLLPQQVHDRALHPVVSQEARASPRRRGGGEGHPVEQGVGHLDAPEHSDELEDAELGPHHHLEGHARRQAALRPHGVDHAVGGGNGRLAVVDGPAPVVGGLHRPAMHALEADVEPAGAQGVGCGSGADGAGGGHGSLGPGDRVGKDTQNSAPLRGCMRRTRGAPRRRLTGGGPPANRCTGRPRVLGAVGSALTAVVAVVPGEPVDEPRNHCLVLGLGCRTVCPCGGGAAGVPPPGAVVRR